MKEEESEQKRTLVSFDALENDDQPIDLADDFLDVDLEEDFTIISDSDEHHFISGLGPIYRQSPERREELINSLEEYSQTNPDAYDSLVILGRLYGEAESHVEAVVAFERAKAIRPDRSELIIELALGYISLDSFEQAGELIAEHIEQFDGNARLYRLFAVVQMAQGELESAWESAATADTLEPDSFETMVLLGDIEYALGRHSWARASYSTALELKPDSASTFFRLGKCWRHLGDLENEIESYQKAWELDENFYEASIALGTAFLNSCLNPKPRWFEFPDELDSIDLSCPDQLLRYAAFQVYVGLNDEALGSLELLRRLDLKLARYLEKLLRQHSGIEISFSSGPNTHTNLRHRRTSPKELSRSPFGLEWSEKLKNLLELEQLSPKNFEIPLQIGEHYYQVSDLHAAESWLRKSINIRHSLRALYLVGRINCELGDLEAAFLHFEAAYLLSPNFIDAKFALGALYILSHHEEHDDLVSFPENVDEINEADPDHLFHLALFSLATHEFSKAETYAALLSGVDTERESLIFSILQQKERGAAELSGYKRERVMKDFLEHTASINEVSALPLI